MNQTALVMLASIFMKLFSNGIVIIDDINRYEFVKFEALEEIEIFKGIDWMIDYNEVKDLKEEETIALGQNIVKNKNNIVQRFNFMTQRERKKNMNMVSQCNLLNFKMYSLRDILWLKQ